MQEENRNITPCFQSFEYYFVSLLDSPTQHRGEIVSALLRESLRQKASEINVEPGIDSECGIFFRINGRLWKALAVSGRRVTSLREALLIYAYDLHPGLYGVVEGKLALLEHSKKILFYYYNIPQAPFNSILIRNATISTQRGNIQRKEDVSQKKSTRNIDKKIFIWQMGKVGSSTIYRSLLPYSRPCTWNVPSIQNNTYWPTCNNIIQTHSIKLLYDFLHCSDEEFVVVSLVRDLLARNISSIFQSMNDEEEWRNQQFIANIADFQEMTYEQQEEKIYQQLLRLNTGTAVTSWYDNFLKSHYYYPEIDKYFINIYSKPFDQENGYQVYESKIKRVNMIILQLEKLNEHVEVLERFLGIENLELVSDNISTEKWYNKIYQKFKNRYKPTNYEIESIYNSRFMKYFYSPNQIQLFASRWK